MILIAGTPGTGKTTLGKKLKEKSFEVIHLTNLVRENKLYSYYDEELESYVIDKEKLVSKVLDIKDQENSGPLVVEGVGVTLLPKEEVGLCIILTCDPAVIERRLKKKGYPLMKIERNIDAENLSVILGDALEKFGANRCVRIDTTHLTKQEVFEKVKKIIRERLNLESKGKKKLE